MADGAPITYVAAQLGLAKPTTTLQLVAKANGAGEAAPFLIAFEWCAAVEANHQPTD